MDSLEKASLASADRAVHTGYSTEIAQGIVDQCVDAGVRLAVTLPDDWIALTIARFQADKRVRHVAANREESAVGLCAGAFMSGMGSCALMGASGLMTLVYAMTKINYTYEIPFFVLITDRGSLDDGAKFHVSNGLYLYPVMKAIDLTHVVIDSKDKLPMIGDAYRHARKISRPTVAVLTKKLLQGKA